MRRDDVAIQLLCSAVLATHVRGAAPGDTSRRHAIRQSGSRIAAAVICLTSARNGFYSTQETRPIKVRTTAIIQGSWPAASYSTMVVSQMVHRRARKRPTLTHAIPKSVAAIRPPTCSCGGVRCSHSSCSHAAVAALPARTHTGARGTRPRALRCHRQAAVAAAAQRQSGRRSPPKGLPG